MKIAEKRSKSFFYYYLQESEKIKGLEFANPLNRQKKLRNNPLGNWAILVDKNLVPE